LKNSKPGDLNSFNFKNKADESKNSATDYIE
jgi:hypothetical protein